LQTGTHLKDKFFVYQMRQPLPDGLITHKPLFPNNRISKIVEPYKSTSSQTFGTKNFEYLPRIWCHY